MVYSQSNIPREVKFSKGFPFRPENYQVIYIESRYNAAINNAIRENFEEISAALRGAGCDFVYIPQLIDSLSEDAAAYLYPSLCKKELHRNEVSAQPVMNGILDACKDKTFFSGGLLRLKRKGWRTYVFSYYEFTSVDGLGIVEQCDEFFDRVYTTSRGFSAKVESVFGSLFVEDYDEEDEIVRDADYRFDYEAKRLIKEIRMRVHALRQTGISEYVLKRMFSIGETSETLSRLIITRDYRILLPDYNNLEITMSPLPKAVFILFLNHPKGIVFKELPDYRGELAEIYKAVSGRENLEAMSKSIDDVANPMLNSINEKCSRIREAFVRHFDESLAENYFIRGRRGEPKRIVLPRRLITLEYKA